MSSSEEVKKLPKIRTFADDYKRIKGHAPDLVSSVSTPEESVKKRAEEKATKKEKVKVRIPTKEIKTATEKKSATTAPAQEEGMQKRVTKNIDTADGQVQLREGKDVFDVITQRDELHSLANDVESGLQKQSGKQLDDDAVFDNDSLESGTIIRETKNRRFNVFAATIAAIKKWFSDREYEKKAKEEAKPKVVNPKLRAEKLREASKYSAMPKGVETLVREKSDEKVAAHSNLTITEKVETPSGWTFLKGDADTEDTTPTETVETAPHYITEPETPLVEEIPTPAPASDTDNLLTEVYEAPIDEQPTEADVVAAPAPAEESVDESAVPDIPPTKDVPLKTARTIQEAQLRRRLIRFGVLVAGGVILAVAGISFLIYFFTRETPVLEEPITTRYPVHISAIDTLPLTQNILEAITTKSQSNATGDTLFSIVQTDEAGTTTFAPAAAIFNALAVTAPESFIRSIETVTFGELEEKRFIILKTNDFDRAFAGMLEWEENIGDDLSPFFAQTTATTFTDIVFENRDLRAAGSEDGLFYTFLNANTILIATDKTIIAPLFNLLK